MTDMETVLEKLIERISAYELMNHIIPGAVYLILADRFTSFTFLSEHLLANVILSYFTGVVIGRIGSLLLEGGMAKIKNKKCWFFLNRAPYKDYVQAEKQDKENKLQQLLAVNNMYRALASTALLLLVTILFDWGLYFIATESIIRRIVVLFACLCLLFLFLFSFRKQTNYIRARVEALNQDQSEAGK